MLKIIKEGIKKHEKGLKVVGKLSPLLIMFAIIAFQAVFAGERDELITLSSGSPGGAYYPLGGGMAEVVSRNTDGLRLDSESTGGSVENIRLVGNRESEMGMAMESAAYKAIEGMDPFSRPYPVKVLFNMYTAPLHIIAVADSGIETIQDLVGKRVSIDSPGSGAEEMARTVLEELGLIDQVNTVNYGQSDAAAALRDGSIDAVFWNFAYPGSAVMEVRATRDLTFISLSSSDMDKIIESHPYFIKDKIPEGTYDDRHGDVDVLSVNNVIVVHEDMDEDLVYTLTKTILADTDRLIEIHSVARHITIENAQDTTLEMHPGALRFFEKERE